MLTGGTAVASACHWLASQAEQELGLSALYSVYTRPLFPIPLSVWSKNLHFKRLVIADHFLLIVMSKFTPPRFTQQLTFRIENSHFVIQDVKYPETKSLGVLWAELLAGSLLSLSFAPFELSGRDEIHIFVNLKANTNFSHQGLSGSSFCF